MKTLLLISFFLCMSPVVALSQEDTSRNCADPQNQNEMNTCAQDDYNTADKELNEVYKKAMATQIKLDEDSGESDPEVAIAAKSLKKAQRAWIDYRDGHCDGVGQLAGGGSMQPLLVFGCKAQLTKTRIKELKELMDGLGNR